MVNYLKYTLLALNEDEYQSTKQIAQKIDVGWTSTFTHLVRLEAMGLAVCISVRCGKREHLDWKRVKGVTEYDLHD
jgi:Mn-dependent DtxR family transcriptional regulator